MVVALGSNLGDRLATLREAVVRIDEVSPVLARSRIYETTPIGGPPQGEFLNAAVLVALPGNGTAQEPARASADRALALLDELQRIEHELARVRDVRWGPRTIDLDILWIEGTTLDETRLTVPHPRLRERAFALLPLLDVAQDAIDPRTDRTFASDLYAMTERWDWRGGRLTASPMSPDDGVRISTMQL